MKAVVIESENVLSVRDNIPEPEIGEYDALVEILFGTTCTSTDGHVISGEFPWPIIYPTILGHESIGRAVKVGSKVRTFKVGDLITRVGTPPVPSMGLDVNWGGYAEYGISRDHFAMREDGIDRAEWQSYTFNQLLPEGTDPAAATMFITWRETYSYTKHIKLPTAKRVLVIGSGGVALSFIVHALNFGVKDIAVVGSSSREALFRKAGATQFFNYRAAADAVNAAAGESGYDLMIDSMGQADSADTYLSTVSYGGTVAIYGLDEQASRKVTLAKSRGSFTYFDHGGYNEAEVHEEVLALFLAGKLDASLWMDLDHPYDMDDINAAYQAVRDRKAVKALVRIRG